MQDRPVCFQCDEPVQTNAEMIFEAPCGHETCSSAVFHPLCLFDWRERRQRYEEWFEQVRQRWIEQHQNHENSEDERQN